MKIELDKTFAKKLSRSIEKYNFEVGVLDDKPHYNAQDSKGILQSPPTKTFAGGLARKTTRELSVKSTGEILIDNMKRLGVNILAAPFNNKNSDIIKFTAAFLKMALAKSSPKRVENLLQAVVRNPILKGEYGPNRFVTANIKGFNRHLIDTAQMFKAIRARVKRV